MNSVQRRIKAIKLIDKLEEKTENGAVLRRGDGEIVFEVKMVERNKKEETK